MEKKVRFRSLFLCALAMVFFPAQSLSAKIPAGVELAEVQEVVIGNGVEPGSIDPNKVEGIPGANVTRDLFETLVVQDLEGKTIPGVAKRWEGSDHNKTWTFFLREDAKWSNGDPVTAHDFVYSWQRLADPKTASPYSWFIEMTEMVNAREVIVGESDPGTLGVRAIDDRTLEVRLNTPLPYFVKMMAHGVLAPIHKETVEKYGSQWTKPKNIVSNGAFKLAEWTVNEKIVMVRNENYWNNDATVLNKVTLLPIENAIAELNRYKAGEIDVTSTVPVEHLTKLKKERPSELKINARLGTYYYAFNVKKAPFDDVRVRRAMAFAVDRDVITKFVTKGGQLPAYTFTPEITEGFNPKFPEWGTMTQKERDAEAKRLFAEAGYGPNNPIKFELLYNTSEGHKKIALAVASMWKQKLGVKVSLNNQEWKTYLDTTNQGNFTVARKGWVGDYNEASTMLDLGLSYHGNNDGGFVNEEYDRLIKAAKTTLDDAERTRLYNAAEAILADEMPYLPLYQYTDIRMVKPHIGGYTVNNPESVHYRRNWYVIKH